MNDHTIDVFIDTPQGSRCKYKLDDDGKLSLSKLLPKGAVFPCNFGSIPGTLAEDGDDLDILVLGDDPIQAGCRVPTKIIGVLEAEQAPHGENPIRNDRLIGVVVTQYNPAELQSVDDLSSQRRRELEHFFQSYNQAEGREFKCLGWRGPKRALKLLKHAQKGRKSKGK